MITTSINSSEMNKNNIASPLWPFAISLSALAILSSALHFWPFHDHKLWQMLLPNFAVLAWFLIFFSYFIYRKGKWKDMSLLPHLSIFAYLIINILSIAFAQNPARAINYTGKLILIFIGGYALFSSAIHNKATLRVFYIIASTALTICVGYCFVIRFILGSENFGFFDNPFKYGTYIGILTPLCVSYSLMRSKFLGFLFGGLITVFAISTSGSIGTIISITIGMIVLLIIVQGWIPRIVIVSSLLIAMSILYFYNNKAMLPLHNDIKLLEADNINLKQRYIEWQAEINLLEERTIPGTAAGAINDYRSNFYYRLPKLNTLKAFDQNGWLASGAETGILGLVIFSWICIYYFKLSFGQLITAKRNSSHNTYKYAAINCVGLISAFVANMFSSVFYNGILIIFILVIVLITKTNLIYAEK